MAGLGPMAHSSVLLPLDGVCPFESAFSSRLWVCAEDVRFSMPICRHQRAASRIRPLPASRRAGQKAGLEKRWGGVSIPRPTPSFASSLPYAPAHLVLSMDGGGAFDPARLVRHTILRYTPELPLQSHTLPTGTTGPLPSETLDALQLPHDAFPALQGPVARSQPGPVSQENAACTV